MLLVDFGRPGEVSGALQGVIFGRQNEKKCDEPPKVATRWPPRPLYSEGVVDFEQFLGPLWNPKIDPQSTFGLTRGLRNRFLIFFLSIFAVSADFLIFVVDFSSFFD